MEELFHAIKDRSSLYSFPPLVKEMNKQDKSIFYEFHDIQGHTGAEYRDLRNQVEGLVRNHFLDKYINNACPISNQPHTVEEENASHMICE